MFSLCYQLKISSTVKLLNCLELIIILLARVIDLYFIHIVATVLLAGSEWWNRGIRRELILLSTMNSCQELPSVISSVILDCRVIQNSCLLYFVLCQHIWSRQQNFTCTLTTFCVCVEPHWILSCCNNEPILYSPVLIARNSGNLLV